MWNEETFHDFPNQGWLEIERSFLASVVGWPDRTRVRAPADRARWGVRTPDQGRQGARAGVITLTDGGRGGYLSG